MYNWFSKRCQNTALRAMQELDFCELFAGCANMARTFGGSGLRVGAADKMYGPGMDINTSAGFGPFA